VNPEALSTLFDLTGRVAIVTGGTRGIGLAIAEGFVSAGASVVVASRKADACREAEIHLKRLAEQAGKGGGALGVPTHLGEIDGVETLVAASYERFGQIDVVVNNAANALAQPAGTVTPDAWQKVMDVNLRGPVFLVQAALPHLEESEHASVINIISVGAFLFSPMTGMYAASKAGLLAYTRSSAADLTSKGIRFNAIAPGTIDTDMVRNNPPEVQESMAKASLMRRAAHPDELVGPALLLASDAGSFMTGSVLVVDGGLAAH
jgi:NAD(P)-dependent dehydrogenase (short-subunit alcohol dehydrogenase family)